MRISAGFHLLAIAFAVFPALVAASSFFPDPAELAALDKNARAEQKAIVNSLLADVPADQKTIRIDDMRFDIGEIRANSAFSGTRWTGGRVWYEFDGNVTEENRARWRAAAEEWEAIADISFRERSGEYNYIHVTSGDENWSDVGCGTGKREMELSNWGNRFIIVHEMGHTLGQKHEHQRTGRDDRIDIHWDKIESGKASNFYWCATTRYGGYDFDSIMHYGRAAFSTDGTDTITPLSDYSEWLDLIGQREYLTTLDKSGMAERYGSVSREVTFPGSGEDDVLIQNQTYTITWRGFTDTASRVELLLDGDLELLIADDVRQSSFEWTVPSDLLALDGYRIRVTSTDDDSRTAQSEHPFTILREPRVLYPTEAGVTWSLGAQYEIEWENMRGTGNVKIELLDAGEVCRTIAASASDDGSLLWTVPNDLENDTSYTVRVAPVAYPDLGDVSDNEFEINTDPYVSVESHSSAGGPPWMIGEELAFSFGRFPDEDEDVRLILVNNDSGQEEVINESARMNFVHTWVIPDSWWFGDYSVRAESLIDSSRHAHSSSFGITSTQDVLAPAENAVWYRGGRHVIRWTDFLGPTVNITLYKNYFFEERIAEDTPNDGDFTWTVPDYPEHAGDIYVIEIASTENHSQTAESPWFKIADPPALVTVPSDPGEAWPTLSDKTIQWTGFTGDTVRIELYRGEPPASAALSLSAPPVDPTHWTLAADAPNTGSFAWTVPTNMPNDTDYRVRITSNDDETIFDESDNAFLIYPGNLVSAFVTYPTASDVVWQKGQAYPIQWRNYSGNTNVRIDLYRDGVFERILANPTANDGLYYWTVISGVDVGSSYTIRVRGLTDGDSDYSDHRFRIRGNQVITTPSGSGVEWSRGEMHTIEWSEFRSYFEVRIELCRDGVPIYTIVPEILNLATGSSYDWDIPDALDLGIDALFGAACQIKITSGDNEEEYAFSDPFLIKSQAYVGVAGPGQFGPTLGANNNIVWGGLAAKLVRIDLYQNGEFVRNITPSQDNTGQFQWPASKTAALPGANYQIRIISLDPPYEFVFIKDPFVLAPAPIADIPKPAWRAGCDLTARWRNFPSNVRILLVNDAKQITEELAKGLPGQGSYTWKIPASFTSAEGYELRVESEGGALSAASSGFSILPPPQILIISTKTIWEPNTIPTITWENFSGESVRIHLLGIGPLSAGMAANTVITSQTTNDGSYAYWTIPPNLPAGTGYRVQIVSLADPQETAQTSPFTVKALAPTVISPTSPAEIWYAEGEYAIEWVNFTAEKVRIDLYLENRLAGTIKEGLKTTGNGLFVWTIEKKWASRAGYRIRVTSEEDPDEYDSSDNSFAILEVPTILTSPTGASRIPWGRLR